MNGDELRKAITELGFSQPSFAEALGVGLRTVVSWLRDERDIPHTTVIIVRLMQRFELAPADITTING